jgi:ubiquinone/menaquinone biosynthesis C-methylase UbiE
MLGKAKDKLKNDEHSKNIQFKFGYGNDTGLEAECADIITCSSSFQWMEPESTIREVLRILKNGGVFAMYNHGQTSGFDWTAEKAYENLFDRIYRFMDDNREKEGSDKLWTNSEYMSVMKKNGEFRFVKEIQVHNTVRINAEGIIGFALSQGALQAMKKMKVSWLENEISQFIETVKGSIGNNEVDALYSYSLRVAIR